MPLFIGTSGWQYKDWRGSFYPPKLAQARWLEYYIEHFQTVEVNNTFYRLPPPETFAGWARRVPDDFVMVVKMSRYLTHVKRLHDPAEPVARFFDHARPLGSKLGPVLVQLPPQLAADLPALDDTLARFPRGVRAAVEFRHESWFSDDTAALLSRHNAAFCLADSPRRRTPVWRTADWGYVRFHEGRASPPPCYGRQALHSWADRISGTWSADDDVFVFFNNDHRACAVRDAGLFADVATQAGLCPTRVPSPSEVRLATS
jgi:uncharacterized protein YecE (DUF72 family)